MRVKTNVLRDLFAVVRTQTTEVTIVSDEKGWHCFAVDPSQISMVQMDVPVSAFEGYESCKPFAVDVVKVLSALKTAEEYTEVEIGDKFRFRVGRVLHTLPLGYAIEDSRTMHELEFNAFFVVDSGPVRDLLTSAACSPSSDCYIRVEDGESIRIAALNDTADGVDMRISAAECAYCEGNASCRFNLAAMTALLKALPKGEVLDVSMRDNYPILFRFGGSEYEGRWMAAPVIPDDDDVYGEV